MEEKDKSYLEKLAAFSERLDQTGNSLLLAFADGLACGAEIAESKNKQSEE